MSLSIVHQEPNHQVTLFETDNRYYSLLENRFGKRFQSYRKLWQQTSEREDPGPFPLSLDLAVNSGCQLCCRMCPLPSRAEPNNPMAETLFLSLMDQAKEHQLPALTMGLGSEPLLNPKTPKWISIADHAGIMDIRLGTNGLLLSRKLIAQLLDSGLTRLEISVDATNEETYRSIRRGGDFHLLEANIELFLNLRRVSGQSFPLLRLSFLELPQNQTQISAFLSRWQSTADLISIQKAIWFPGSDLLPPTPSGPSVAKKNQCCQPWQRLAVTSQGHIWPCCSWYGEKLIPLNANHLEISRAWISPAFNQLRDDLIQGHPQKSCQDCQSASPSIS